MNNRAHLQIKYKTEYVFIFFFFFNIYQKTQIFVTLSAPRIKYNHMPESTY